MAGEWSPAFSSARLFRKPQSQHDQHRQGSWNWSAAKAKETDRYSAEPAGINTADRVASTPSHLLDQLIMSPLTGVQPTTL